MGRCNLVAMPGNRGATLDLADATRRGREKATAYELWEKANAESVSETERRDVYRHAMIHAGHLVTKAGTPFQRCPICREKL